MNGSPFRPLVFGLMLALAAGLQAGQKSPGEVRDLHYGEVLFHFYQDDYFNAITNLMAARERDQLPNHARDAELLLGGLQLSYGLRRQAEQQFRRVLDEGTDAEVRNRVWYYLGKIAYQRGLYDEAKAALQQLSESRDRELVAERALLIANSHMQQGQDAVAARELNDVRAPHGLREYLQINRAIALLRSGDIEAGRDLLNDIGRESADSEELRALRDRANLALGYELLRAGHAEQARIHLNRVRLNGPFAAPALLGAGWADAERGAFEQALTPWLELGKHSSFNAPVQEAQLAVPYAFEKLGDQSRAVHFYKAAISYFDREQMALEAAVEDVRAGRMLELLNRTDTGRSGGWLQRNPTLEGVPAGQYLIDMMAGNRFQESLKQYRDLTFLDRFLAERLDSIGVFNDMVDARRLAYEQRAPGILARIGLNEAGALRKQMTSLEQRLEAQRRGGDPLGLATGKELEHWSRLESIKANLAGMPDQPRFAKMTDRARWLQGVLYWDIQKDYEGRLWRVTKELNTIQQPLRETEDRTSRIAGLLEDVKSGFQGYEERIASLRGRIVQLQSGVRVAHLDVGEYIEKLAMEELELRRQRIASYRSQARYALARSYDQLASRAEDGE